MATNMPGRIPVVVHAKITEKSKYIPSDRKGIEVLVQKDPLRNPSIQHHIRKPIPIMIRSMANQSPSTIAVKWVFI